MRSWSSESMRERLPRPCEDECANWFMMADECNTYNFKYESNCSTKLDNLIRVSMIEQGRRVCLELL